MIDKLEISSTINKITSHYVGLTKHQYLLTTMTVKFAFQSDLISQSDTRHQNMSRMNQEMNIKIKPASSDSYLDWNDVDKEANEPLGCNDRPRTATTLCETVNIRTFLPRKMHMAHGKTIGKKNFCHYQILALPLVHTMMTCKKFNNVSLFYSYR